MKIPFRLYLFILILLLFSACLTDYCKEGNDLMAEQKYKEAIICFDKVLSTEPANIKALNGKGQCLFNMEKYDEAIGCFDKALSLDPNNGDIWLNKGGALYKKYYYELELAKSEGKGFITFDPLTGTGILNDQKEMGEKEKEIKACLDKVLEIEANPDNPSGWYNRGLAFYYRGDYQDALECFDEILSFCEIDLRTIGNVKDIISDEKMKKLKTLMNKEFTRKELRKNLEKLTFTEKEIDIIAACSGKSNRKKSNEKALYFMGCSFFFQKEYDSAIEYLDRVLFVNPHNMDAFIIKSDALYSQRQYEEAVKCLDEALKVAPESYAVLINKAYILYNMKKYEEALDCLNKASEIKMDTYALYLKGSCLYNQGKYKEGIIFYDRALKLYPEYTEALICKGDALYDSGKYNEALECFNKALEAEPNNVSALGGKGLVLLEKKDYRGSINCYDRLLAIDSNYSDVYLYKAKALTGLGNYRKALKCYDRALKMDPSYEEAKKDREKFIKDYSISQNILEADEMVEKGYAYLKSYVYSSNKIEDAMKCFNMALDVDPENTDAWVGKAETLTDVLGYTSLEYGATDELLAKVEKAVECYDMALEIDPSDESLYTGKLSMLHFLVEEGEHDRRKAYNEEIVRVCNELLKVNSHSRAAYNNRGYAFASLGMKKEALKSFDTLVSYYPDSMESYRSRGMGCFSMGLNEEALKSLDKFLSYYPDYYSDRLETDRTTVMRVIETKGDILYKEKKYMEAISCYDEAYKIYMFIGSHDQYYINYLDGDPGMRRLDMLEKDLTDMLVIPAREKSPDEWVQMGKAFTHFHRPNKARRCFEKARELDPNMDIN